MFTIIFSIAVFVFSLTVFRIGDYLIDRLAYSVLLSLGMAGVIPFFTGEYFHIAYTQSYKFVIATAVVILFITVLIWKFRRIDFNIQEIQKHFKFSLSTLLIVIFGFLVITKGSVTPIQGWDAFSMYDARAKYLLSGLKFTDLEFSRYDIHQEKYYAGYPPMTSNIHIIFYTDGNISPMVIYGLFYFAYILLLLVAIKKVDKIPSWLKFICFVATAFNPVILIETTIAYSNLPMLAFQFAAIVSALSYIQTKKLPYIFLSGIFIAFSTWTRSTEPTFIAFLLADLLIIFIANKRPLKRLFSVSTIFIVISVCLRQVWSSYVMKNFGQINQISLNPLKLMISFIHGLALGNIVAIANFIYTALLIVKDYFILFLFLLVIILARPIWQKRSLTLTYLTVLTLIYLMIIATGTVLLSQVFIDWKLIPGSLLRTVIVILPVIIMMGIYTYQENTKLINE